jgi:hypothetical protein
LYAEVGRLPERVADLPQPIIAIVVEALRFMREKQHGKLEFSCADGAFTLMAREQQRFPK